MNAMINQHATAQVLNDRSFMTRADMVGSTASHVKVIPATKPNGVNAQLKARTDIRVAGYCRVSTGDESQQTSYTNQKAYYSGLIHSKKGWKFAGLYADEGISGTSVAHRTQFNQMIQDAKDGKIDYIVTKSISRFARNTLDTLTYVRELKELNPKVGIFFEKENLDTLDVRGEMVLTVLAAIAQEESHSISENIRWGIRKRFEAGIPQVNLNRTLGYDMGENGEWIINETQAAIVRTIYAYFINGLSALSIAQGLNDAGIYTVLGNKWTSSTVLRILRNEKYVGDIEMQKTYTKDFLSHRAESNKGELPKYYIKDHHIPIIGRGDWEKAQEKLARRERGMEKDATSARGAKPAVLENLTCGADCASCSMAAECGKKFSRLTYSVRANGYTDERSIAATGVNPNDYAEAYMFSHPVWKHRAENKASVCPLAAINECAVKQSFMEMLYKIKRDYEANGKKSKICQDFGTSYNEMVKSARENSTFYDELLSVNKQLDTLEAGINENLRKQTEAMCDLAIDTDADLADAVAVGEISRKDMFTDIWNGLKHPEQGSQFYHVEIPEDSPAAIYAELVRDLRNREDELLVTRNRLEQVVGTSAKHQEQFEAFLKAIANLPTKNAAGMELKINGLDTNGSILRDLDGKAKANKRSAIKRGHLVMTPERIANAPDILDFAEEIYREFIVEGTVHISDAERVCDTTEDGQLKAGQIEYKTTFGLTLVSAGNGRPTTAFLGFKRNGIGKDGMPDGTLQFIDQNYKVDGGKIRYKRTERRRSRNNDVIDEIGENSWMTEE